MNFEEFLKPKGEVEEQQVNEEVASEGEIVENEPLDEGVELDVQKAVVEELAADKAEQDEKIAKLKGENDALAREILQLKAQLAELKGKVEVQSQELAKVSEILTANEVSETSSKIALLDRNLEVDDRFAGETRDHVLEVLKEARDKAEQEGQSRRAQLLESVLVSNEPNGTLAEKRSQLVNLFKENGNILSGPVLVELEKLGISHKKGEEYLLPAEIIKRTY